METMVLTAPGVGRDSQQQGRKANSNGRYFEQLLCQSLRSRGYAEYRAVPAVPRFAFFIYQFKGRFVSIYGLPMTVDLYLWHPTKYPQGLIIECKYQETAGTADEKFPYTVFSLQQAGIPAILLVIGQGAKRKAVRWCLSQQSELLKVFDSFEAFLLRANGGLL